MAEGHLYIIRKELHVQKCCVLLVLQYGCEACTNNKHMKNYGSIKDY